ncbi:DUF4097 family beta strand repeat-containing protein [Cellulomonas wangsupingiae]|uniref:DUF4097 domain-containing protein n=1 Tax=Cellulomonas wangsupingiae TaxID=2968085 RepID=A0ABY5K2M5_9CELL|nr:DUF4097 family beta strand repeat-containing protein [Cellulomonas wangsupingiae]MCC2336422.1 DUF4097 domain-containing protein [Cellulomonas wangsupingiae]UUI64696.1 DUF4097 domain-containing protein [Cellulomonas wangsupingiae]
MTATQPTHLPAPPPPAPAGPPAAPRAARARPLAVVGGVLAVLLLAYGVLQVLAWMFTRTTSATATLAATDVVELVADGEVLVTVSAVDDVRVERVARFAWGGPRYEVTSQGDRTVVRHECVESWVSSCSAALEVTVPEGTHVVVRAVDGDVRVAGPAADVEVRAADGEVEVSGARGDLDVRGRDGDVTAQGVRGGVAVELSDGDVRVTEAGGDVTVGGRDGAVVLADVGGDADVRTSDGRIEVRDVGGALTVRKRDGDVGVAQVRGDVTVQAVDGDVTVHGTGDPVALQITSNGRQRVEGATDPGAAVHVDLRTVDGDVSYLGPAA